MLKVLYQRPLYGVFVAPNPYRAVTREMIALPPLRFQNTSAALSSEARSMKSSALRSSGES